MMDCLRLYAQIVKKGYNKGSFGKKMGWGKNKTTTRMKGQNWRVDEARKACLLLELNSNEAYYIFLH